MPFDRESLRENSHGMLSYFDHRQNRLSIEGKLKIILQKKLKNNNDIIMNHKGTRMVKDGEDRQTTKLKNVGETFETLKPCAMRR